MPSNYSHSLSQPNQNCGRQKCLSILYNLWADLQDLANRDVLQSFTFSEPSSRIQKYKDVLQSFRLSEMTFRTVRDRDVYNPAYCQGWPDPNSGIKGCFSIPQTLTSYLTRILEEKNILQSPRLSYPTTKTGKTGMFYIPSDSLSRPQGLEKTEISYNQ